MSRLLLAPTAPILRGAACAGTFGYAQARAPAANAGPSGRVKELRQLISQAAKSRTASPRHQRTFCNEEPYEAVDAAGVEVAAAPVAATDEELMLRYASGDMSAFEALYGRHKDRLFGYLLRACSSRDLAGELFQDVWAKVVAARDRYAATGSFGGWLFRLAHHRLMDHFRTVPKMAEALENIPEPLAPRHHEPERQEHSRQARHRILRALAQLPEEQRTAFLLQQEGELSLEEIASITDVGRETVKSRLRYALAKLRQELSDV